MATVEPHPSVFRDLLTGAVDLHIHSGPDIFPRCMTAIEAARAAEVAGMAAIVLKSHSTDTAARAEMVREITGFPTYGGVTLNYPVGGLNPHAVLESARQGGRCVWFPSINARNFILRAHLAPMLAAAIPKGVRGLSASHRGRLLSDVERILDLVAEHRMLLCGGHLDAPDTGLLFEGARRRGIERMVVNHVDAGFMGISIDQARELADAGAFIEVTKIGPIELRAQIIRAIGVERCVIATDAGPLVNPPPARLLHETLAGLRANGFSDHELRHLSVDAPSFLIGLEGCKTRPPTPAGRGR